MVQSGLAVDWHSPVTGRASRELETRLDWVAARIFGRALGIASQSFEHGAVKFSAEGFVRLTEIDASVVRTLG